MRSDKLTIALTKGRILKETLPLLARAGVEPLESIDKSRKLIFPTTRQDVQMVVMRGVDVPVYVRHPTRFNLILTATGGCSPDVWWTASHRRGVPCWADSRTDAGEVRGPRLRRERTESARSGGVQAARG